MHQLENKIKKNYRLNAKFFKIINKNMVKKLKAKQEIQITT